MSKKTAVGLRYTMPGELRKRWITCTIRQITHECAIIFRQFFSFRPTVRPAGSHHPPTSFGCVEA